MNPLVVTDAAFSDIYYRWGVQNYSAQDVYHQLDRDYYQVYTAVKCLADVIPNAGDTGALKFPRLARTQQDYENFTEASSLTNLSKAETYVMPGDTSQFRLIWTALPEALFDGNVSGAILLSPRNANSESAQQLTTCTLAAGWGTSSAVEDGLNAGEIWSSPTNIPKTLDSVFSSEARTRVGTAATIFGPLFANASGSVYPQRPIQVPTGWLEYLNPTLLLQDGTNTTAINAYMSVFSGAIEEVGVANVITIMMLFGISLNGLDLPWQGTRNMHN